MDERSDEGQIYRFHNRSNADLVYIGCKLYGFASAHDGIHDYAKNGSTFGDKIAGASRFAPGGKLKIDDYAMSFDGEFVGTHRVVLMRDCYHVEACASIGKLAWYLWDRKIHGIHRLIDAENAPE